MNRQKRTNLRYVAVNLLAIVSLIAFALLFAYLRRVASMTYQHFPAYYTVACMAPLVTSLLFFIKIYMQRGIPVKFSRIVNLVTLLLLIAAIFLFFKLPFYPMLSFFNLIDLAFAHPTTLFALGLQTYALLFDLFRKDAAPREAAHPENLSL